MSFQSHPPSDTPNETPVGSYNHSPFVSSSDDYKSGSVTPIPLPPAPSVGDDSSPEFDPIMDYSSPIPANQQLPQTCVDRLAGPGHRRNKSIKNLFNKSKLSTSIKLGTPHNNNINNSNINPASNYNYISNNTINSHSISTGNIYSMLKGSTNNKVKATAVTSTATAFNQSSIQTNGDIDNAPEDIDLIYISHRRRTSSFSHFSRSRLASFTGVKNNNPLPISNGTNPAMINFDSVIKKVLQQQKNSTNQLPALTTDTVVKTDRSPELITPSTPSEDKAVDNNITPLQSRNSTTDFSGDSDAINECNDNNNICRTTTNESNFGVKEVAFLIPKSSLKSEARSSNNSNGNNHNNNQRKTATTDKSTTESSLSSSLSNESLLNENTCDHTPGYSPVTISSSASSFISSKPMFRTRATTLDIPGLTKSKVSPDGTVSSIDLGSKLVIVMVGLPARGKSYITNKLCRYLTWQQHRCKIFNVGNTRRKANTKFGPSHVPLSDNVDISKLSKEEQLALHEQYRKQQQQKLKEEEMAKGNQEHDAAFFSPNNKESSTLRETWAMDTLDQLLDYILLENGTVGILDATNTTRQRRSKVLERINERTQGQLRVLFLESICTQPEIIERNIRLKLSGPDYKDKDTKKALSDFVGRLRNYEKAYETLDDNDTESDLQYCKIINAGARTITNNIKGFLSGQAVFFMLNFNLSERQIWICRHGESEDNVVGRIGGDSNLTVRGRKFSKTLTKFIEYQKKLFFAHQVEKMRSEGRLDLSGGSAYSSGTTTPVKAPESPMLSPTNGGNSYDHNSHDESCVELNFSVWSSMMRRAVQTAEYFNEENFDVKQMRMLNEIGAGNCDGMTYAEIRQKYPHEYENRMSDKIHYRYPGMGGESYLDVIARLRQVIVEIERMEDHALIIAHRVVCRVLLAYFMNLSRDSIGDLDVPLHTLYVLEPKPYGVNWEMYEYSEKADWFFKVPKESIPRRVKNTKDRARRSSTVNGDLNKNTTANVNVLPANVNVNDLISSDAINPATTYLSEGVSEEVNNDYSYKSEQVDTSETVESTIRYSNIMTTRNRRYSVLPSSMEMKSVTGADDIIDVASQLKGFDLKELKPFLSYSGDASEEAIFTDEE